MRNLLRNQRRVWYRTYEGRVPVVDADGHDTGVREVTYSEPVEARANVSPATGTSSQEMFGTAVDYDRVVQLPGTGWPVDERTQLYIDAEPPARPDYAVVRVAESLNQTSLAARRLRGA